MMPRLKLFLFIVIGSLFSCHNAFSQCFQIESILVDACDTGSNEGFNEMVRFKVGNAALNTSTLSVTWPNNSWTGLIQNAGTATKVAQLNAQVASAGGCGQILEPTSGVLPANAKVVLVTSFNFGVTANVFGALTDNLYIIFQNNPTVTTGHFANYNATPGIRTLIMNFGACSDTVSYERSLLVNINGASGGTAAEQNGSTVNFTPAGVASYVNFGCVAPIETFTVDAGPPSISACPSATIALSGTALGVVQWTAATGTFSAPNALVTNYTVPPDASGSIVLTLTATNVCDSSVSDNITVNITQAVIPTFNIVPSICTGTTLNPLPTTSANGVTGTWSPALNNTATTTYTFTPNTGQCASLTTAVIMVLPQVTPTFIQVPAICSGSPLLPLPTTSTNGITGTWLPAINNTATTTYTFTPNPGQCATTATMTVTVNNGNTIPAFNPVAPICTGAPLAALPATSLNNITGTWAPALNNTATTTYTFTPNTGQCAAAATLTIVVNVLVIPAFNLDLTICSGSQLSPLPTTSTNGITGTWSPAPNNLATTTYTFTPNQGQCATSITWTIVVSPGITPQFNAVAPICSGDVLSPLPTTSLNGVFGSWSPAPNNMATTTYTFTPIGNACYTPVNLTIVVNLPNVTPLFAAVAPICAGANLPPLPTTSLNGITGTWSPALNNIQTTIYTFTPDAGQCAANATLQITVVSDFNFEMNGSCSGSNFILSAKFNSGTTTGDNYNFDWKNSNGISVGTNSSEFNVSAYLNSTPQAEAFPMTFTLTVTPEDGCPKTQPFMVENIYCDIQRGISPNGDASNEFFDLTSKEVKALSIFNRYGKKVYFKQGYTNQWKGQADNGNELPDAAYFYVIDWKSGTASRTGWIYINR